MRLVEGDIALRNNSGFSFVEVLAASSLATLFIAILLPLFLLIEKERNILTDRLDIADYLFNESISISRNLNETSATSYQKTINDKVITVEIIQNDADFEICALWENIQGRKEDLCFHGNQ